ncbi:MAG: hypothetical protein PHF83_05855 [Candidatus Methanomethylophilus sp.]|nr:hypothetical protein [Methanomethylophilus sp.]
MSFFLEGNPGIKATQSFTVTPTYTITATAGTGGTVSGQGTYSEGSSVTLTAHPSSGYSFASWTENGSVVSTSANYSFTASADRTLTASFSENVTPPTPPTPPTTTTYTLTATAGSGGAIAPTVITVSSGDSQTFTVTPNSGMTVDRVLVDGQAAVLTDGKYTFADVVANHTIVVTFRAVVDTTTVTVTAGDGGTISPGTGNFQIGEVVDFTITPNDGKTIDQVLVNGKAVEVTDGTLSAVVTDNMTVEVSFKDISPSNVWLYVAVIVIIIVVIVVAAFLLKKYH